MNAIVNPNVPFNVSIPGGVQPGRLIKIQGFTPYVSKRFAINLLCGPIGDVALHVCPNFDQKCVIRNTIQNMQMGCEEKSGIIPIHPGQNFELLILCDHQNFKIAFNGQHFTEFNHRLPYNAITNLAVDGQVVIHSVNYDKNLNTNMNIGMVIPPPSYGPTPGPVTPPYPAGSVPGGMPYSSNSQGYGPTPYPNNNSVYPPAAGYGINDSLYPRQPPGGYAGSYPANGVYPNSHQQFHGGHPQPQKTHKSTGFLDKAGMAVAGVLGGTALLGGNKNKLNSLGEKLGAAMATATAFTDQLNPKKAMKKQMKAHKKALKYGLPLAGAGIGAYALSKGFHGFRRSSSSSSSSSD